MRSPVDYTSRSDVASIMLASPETGNALSPELLSTLTEAIERAEREASCRAILLVAAGPSFSQGADFTSVFTPSGMPDPAYTEVFLRCMQSILRASRPVISWLGREDVAEGIQQFADGFSPPWFQRYKGPGYICPHE